jgi:hypothetical protein
MRGVQQKRAPTFGALSCGGEESAMSRYEWLFRENRRKSFNLILIVQHHYRYYSHRLLAEVALHSFTLQVLQKSIRKSILGPFAPRFLLPLRAAMRTEVFHYVLLRIAV